LQVGRPAGDSLAPPSASHGFHADDSGPSPHIDSAARLVQPSVTALYAVSPRLLEVEVVWSSGFFARAASPSSALVRFVLGACAVGCGGGKALALHDVADDAETLPAGDASDTVQPAEATDAAPDGLEGDTSPVVLPAGEVYPNLFAAHACQDLPGTHFRDTYCGGAQGGTAADFDSAAFARLYDDLDDAYLYSPPSGPGSYERLPVPKCEDGTSTLGPDGTCTFDGKSPIRCTDGTRPIAWVRAPDAESSHARDWLVHVQGGDDTCGTHDAETNCFAFAREHFSSGLSEGRRDANGIFASAAVPGAPPFHEFGAIYLDKCVGDRNLGDAMIPDYPFLAGEAGTDGKAPPVSNGGLYDALPDSYRGKGPVYFHGRRILRAVVATLVRTDRLVSSSRLLVEAQSNGSHGLYQYIDDIAADVDRAAGGDVDVRGVASSYLRSSIGLENAVSSDAWGAFDLGGMINAPKSTAAGLTAYNTTFESVYARDFLYSPGELLRAAHDGIITDDAYIAGGLEAQRFVDWGADPDESCLTAQPRWVCQDAMHVIGGGNLETRVFFAVQAADKVMRRAHMFFGDVGLAPGFGLIYHPEDFITRVLGMVHRIDALDSGHGAFVTHSDDHDSTVDGVKVRRAVGGVMLAQAIYDWAMSPAGSESFCVSLPPAAPPPWYHNGDGQQGYQDTGHDPTFACPGASP
jgi:hypothetical protein